jgi:dihydroorotase
MRPARIITRAERMARKQGLGTKIQSAIHAGVDALPLSDETKAAVKGCAGCGRRATAINKAAAKVKAFFGFGTQMQPPPAPPSG